MKDEILLKKESPSSFFDHQFGDALGSDTKNTADSFLKNEFNLKSEFKDHVKSEFRSPQTLNSSTPSTTSTGLNFANSYNPLNSPSSSMAPIASSPTHTNLGCAPNARGLAPNRSPSRDTQRGVKRPHEEADDGNRNKQSVGVFESLVNTSPQSVGAASMSPAPHSHPNTPHGRPITPLGGPGTPLGRPTTPHGGPTTPHAPSTPNPHGPATPHGGRPPTPQLMGNNASNVAATGAMTPSTRMTGNNPNSNPQQQQQQLQNQQYSDNKMLRSLLSTDGPQVQMKTLSHPLKPNALPQEKLPQPQDLIEKLRRPGPWQTGPSNELILNKLLSEPHQKAVRGNFVNQPPRKMQANSQGPMEQQQQQQLSMMSSQQQQLNRGSPNIESSVLNSMRPSSSMGPSSITSSNSMTSASLNSNSSLPRYSDNNNFMQDQQRYEKCDPVSPSISSSINSSSDVNCVASSSGGALNTSNSNNNIMNATSSANFSNCNMMGNVSMVSSINSSTTTLPRFSVSMGGINPLGNLPADGTLPPISRVEGVIMQQSKSQLQQQQQSHSLNQHPQMDQNSENPSSTSENELKQLAIEAVLDVS